MKNCLESGTQGFLARIHWSHLRQQFPLCFGTYQRRHSLEPFGTALAQSAENLIIIPYRQSSSVCTSYYKRRSCTNNPTRVVYVLVARLPDQGSNRASAWIGQAKETLRALP